MVGTSGKKVNVIYVFLGEGIKLRSFLFYHDLDIGAVTSLIVTARLNALLWFLGGLPSRGK